MKPTKSRYDCVVIGGGHNGLVTAAYLARAGKSVCVLERRDVLGGCAVTENLWPGFRVSTAAYVISLFLPQDHSRAEAQAVRSFHSAAQPLIVHAAAGRSLAADRRRTWLPVSAKSPSSASATPAAIPIQRICWSELPAVGARAESIRAGSACRCQPIGARSAWRRSFATPARCGTCTRR